MIKRLGVLTVLVGLAVSSAQASPMGPIRPTFGRFALSFDAASESRKTQWSQNRADLRKANSVMLLAGFHYGLTDRVEVTARLGSADLKLKDVADVGPSGPFIAIGDQVNCNNKLAWGLGLSGVLYDAITWDLSGQANYFAHIGHNAKGPYTTSDIDYFDYNFGLQAQGKFEVFQPYIGIYYSNCSVDYTRVRGNGTAYRDDQKKLVGVFGGGAVELTPMWSAYVECRLVAENSLSGGIRYTF